jgi:hypothetical protein
MSAARTALSAAPRYDPRTDTVESLDARLVALARGDAPLRRVLARIAGRLVETRGESPKATCAESPKATGAGWEPLGFARAADYARERPGWSARELHDLACVGAALARLPALEAAFAGGRLGWTKVRLLCRVATAADEARWLAAAGRLSAAALAREVRACDVGALEAGGAAAAGAEEAPDPEREVLRVRAPRRVLTQWGDVKRMLRLVAGEWLPTETCVELVAAEVLSAVGLDAAADAGPPLARRCRAGVAEGGDAGPGPAAEGALAGAPEPAPGAPAPAALPWVAALADGLDAATPRELDARLCRAAALERSWLARLGPPLLAFADARGHHALGFRSLDAYARERLGMSARKVRALLRVERACARSPALAAAWRAGRLPWSRAHALVAVLLAPGAERFHAAWLARAAQVTARRLEDDVDHALATGDLDPAALPALPPGVQIGAQPTVCETDLAAAEANETWVANVPGDVGRLFRASLCSVQRRLGGPPGAALAAMFAHCVATWRPQFGRRPAEHRVFERDGWRCTVPGCTSYRNLHAHHVVFRSAGGGDDDANLTTLCAFHHQRGVHAGVIRVSGSAPSGLVFELPLGRFRSGDVVAA